LSPAERHDPTKKAFKLSAADFRPRATNRGACYAADAILVDGLLVGHMHRDRPDFENDTGWRFFSGTETQEYCDDPKNFAVYDVNTVANYDPAIVPYLDEPIGTKLDRIVGTDQFRHLT
jgi:hypothetical protein